MRDRELLVAWHNGDAAAGSELFERHYDAVKRFFRSKLDDDVGDLVQTTFLSLLETHGRSAEIQSFRGLLYCVARRQLFAHFGRQGLRADPLRSSIAELATSLSQAAARQDAHRKLVEAMRRIPVDLQVSLELHYWEELSTSELGEALGIPQGTVKSRLLRARECLRRELPRVGLRDDTGSEADLEARLAAARSGLTER